VRTLCCAGQKWQEDARAEKSEFPCFCQIHLFAFLKPQRGPKTISGYSKIFQLLFLKMVKLEQSQSNPSPKGYGGPRESHLPANRMQIL